MIRTQVQISVDTGHGTFPGCVRRMSTRAVQAIFREDLYQEAERGDSMTLVFVSGMTDAMVTVQARLHSTESHGALRSAMFVFDEEETSVRRLVEPDENRREDGRFDVHGRDMKVTLVVAAEIVSMLPEIPGVSVIENQDLRVDGRLRDVSATGAAVEIESWAQSAFVASERVRVVLGPAESIFHLEIDASIRHRKAESGGFVYGLEFSWDSTDQGELQRQLLTLNLERLRLRTVPA